MEMIQDVSFWLLPQPDDRAYLQNVMAPLATRYNAPSFSPHLTVARLQVPYPFQALLDKLVAMPPTLSLATHSLDHSPEFFRAVYIRTALETHLVTLRQSLYRLWPDNPVKPFLPHISLIYQNLGSAERQAIIHSLNIKKKFVFDTLAIVCPQTQGEWTAVDTWQIIGQWPLADLPLTSAPAPRSPLLP